MASENFFAGNSIIPALHAPYSPDLAPTDFWVFQHIKAALTRQQLPGPDDLPMGIREFLSKIQTSEFEFVFRHWIEGVQWVLE
jgi:hypothetical protein